MTSPARVINGQTQRSDQLLVKVNRDDARKVLNANEKSVTTDQIAFAKFDLLLRAAYV